MILKSFKKSLTHFNPGLSFTSLNLTTSFSTSKKDDDFNIDSIKEDKSEVDPNLLEQYIHTVNYNFEENPNYTEKVEEALEKRNMIAELKKKPLIKKAEKYKYDRPRFDSDITNYSVWREFSDSVMTKEYPHELPVLIKIKVAPKDMVHVFGDAVLNERNDNYSTKEWDFVDSNLDKFLVYDCKATTEFWGQNMPDEWYEVSIEILFSNFFSFFKTFFLNKIFVEKLQLATKNEKTQINYSRRILGKLRAS